MCVVASAAAESEQGNGKRRVICGVGRRFSERGCGCGDGDGDGGGGGIVPAAAE